MKKSRFTEEQIVGVLREQGEPEKGSIQWIDHPANGAATAEVCRRHGISEQTFYRWKSKYGGMDRRMCCA